MESQYPPDHGTAASPPIQPQQPTAPRGRGRRAYAAQQYDFNAPAPAVYDQSAQQAQYPAQAYQQQQGQPAAAPAAQGQYGQYPVPAQPGYPQPGYQYGQEYQQPSPSLQPQGFQGQAGVGGITNQFQNMHVSQVSLIIYCTYNSLLLPILSCLSI